VRFEPDFALTGEVVCETARPHLDEALVAQLVAVLVERQAVGARLSDCEHAAQLADLDPRQIANRGHDLDLRWALHQGIL
jgi:hypothetical protein